MPPVTYEIQNSTEDILSPVLRNQIQVVSLLYSLCKVAMRKITDKSQPENPSGMRRRGQRTAL